MADFANISIATLGVVSVVQIGNATASDLAIYDIRKNQRSHKLVAYQATVNKSSRALELITNCARLIYMPFDANKPTFIGVITA